MSIGALAVVERWSEAVNGRDSDRLMQLTHEGVTVVGPRGAVRGRQVLADWLTRAGFSARSLRWFCGDNGTVVVEQYATWVDVATGHELGRSVVASRFQVDGAAVASYQRHDDLRTALAAAGLEERDEVLERRGS